MKKANAAVKTPVKVEMEAVSTKKETESTGFDNLYSEKTSDTDDESTGYDYDEAGFDCELNGTNPFTRLKIEPGNMNEVFGSFIDHLFLVFPDVNEKALAEEFKKWLTVGAVEKANKVFFKGFNEITDSIIENLMLLSTERKVPDCPNPDHKGIWTKSDLIDYYRRSAISLMCKEEKPVRDYACILAYKLIEENAFKNIKAKKLTRFEQIQDEVQECRTIVCWKLPKYVPEKSKIITFFEKEFVYGLTEYLKDELYPFKHKCETIRTKALRVHNAKKSLEAKGYVADLATLHIKTGLPYSTIKSCLEAHYTFEHLDVENPNYEDTYFGDNILMRYGKYSPGCEEKYFKDAAETEREMTIKKALRAYKKLDIEIFLTYKGIHYPGYRFIVEKKNSFSEIANALGHNWTTEKVKKSYDKITLALTHNKKLISLLSVG